METSEQYHRRRLETLMVTSHSLEAFKKHLGFSKRPIEHLEKDPIAIRLIVPRNGNKQEDKGKEDTRSSPARPPISPKTPRQLSALLMRSPRSPTFADKTTNLPLLRSRTNQPRGTALLNSEWRPRQLNFDQDVSIPDTEINGSPLMEYKTATNKTEVIPLDEQMGVHELCRLMNQLKLESSGTQCSQDVTEKELTSCEPVTPTLNHSAVVIERFYFPDGEPIPSEVNENHLALAETVFNSNNGKVSFQKMNTICRLAGIPVYWKRPVFDNCEPDEHDLITFSSFENYWSRMTAVSHDEASRFVFCLTNGSRRYIEFDDLESLVLDVARTHPSLFYFRDDLPFHSFYAQTVICRIVWAANRSWSGRITANELRRSCFLDVVGALDALNDVNDELEFFSYDHYYVVFNKWQLLAPQGTVITQQQLATHDGQAIADLVVARIFSGSVSRSAHSKGDIAQCSTIPFRDFVYFLLAEVDKSHPTSIEYWFRVLDLNGDGRLSMDELERFFTKVQENMKVHNLDSLLFNDMFNLLRDVVKPRNDTFFTLNELKASPKVAYFFNTFINWRKHYEQEVEEISENAENGTMNKFAVYCQNEYTKIVAEEDVFEFDENFNDDNPEEEEAETTMDLLAVPKKLQ